MWCWLKPSGVDTGFTGRFALLPECGSALDRSRVLFGANRAQNCTAVSGVTYLWPCSKGSTPGNSCRALAVHCSGPVVPVTQSQTGSAAASLLPYYNCRLPVRRRRPGVDCYPVRHQWQIRVKVPTAAGTGRSSMSQASGDIMGQPWHTLAPPHRSTPPTWDNWSLHGLPEQAYRRFKGTPIQIDDGLYLCTGRNVIPALDPDSGESAGDMIRKSSLRE